MSSLLTVGHGTAAADEFARLLQDRQVASVVDIRTAPGSRHNPEMKRTELQRWLPEAGIGYRWDKRLGGFRKVPPDSPDTFWRNDAFRAYAGYTREPDFRAAMDDLLGEAVSVCTAVMCSESVWWRCHRRVVADVAVLLHDVTVSHLMHDGRLVYHPPSPGARITAEGLLVYDRPRE